MWDEIIDLFMLVRVMPNQIEMYSAKESEVYVFLGQKLYIFCKNCLQFSEFNDYIK